MCRLNASDVPVGPVGVKLRDEIDWKRKILYFLPNRKHFQQAPLCVAVNGRALFTMCPTTEPAAVTSLNPHSQRFWRHQNETQRSKPLDFADSQSLPT